MTAYTHSEENTRKTYLLISLFLIILIGFGWLISRSTGNPVFLYAFAAFSSVMSVVSYWFSDKIVVALHGGVPVTRESQPELYRIVENLAITAGLPMPKVYVVPELQPNAFATGRDKDHAAVAVTEGLLNALDRSELEGVIAHELAHIGNKDMLLSTVVVVLVGFISVISDIFLRSAFWGGGDRDDDRGGNFAFILAIVAAIVAPIAATLIQLAVSRKREFLADSTGALITRYPEGLASALEKISSDRNPMRSARPATAHLWFANPLKGKKVNLGGLFLTHPPVEERILALREMSI